MGPRREASRITIPRSVRRVVEFQAAESFPLEIAGVLIGDHHRIEMAGTITKYDKRTRETLEFEDEHLEHLVDDLRGELAGGFHSHPGWPETISRPGDCKNGVSKGCSDLEHMEEEAIEWIVSVWPGERKFRFRHRVYMRVGNAPRVLSVEWV